MKRLLGIIGYHIALAIGIFISGIAVHALSAHSAEPLPRTIITFYNSKQHETIYANRAEQLAAMPLNHLGLVIEQYDIAGALPDIKNRKDVRGVLTWFMPGTQLENPRQFLSWASEAVDAGKQFAIMGDMGFLENMKGEETPLADVNAFLAKIGLETSGAWVNSTYSYDFIQNDNTMLGFERGYDPIKPGFLTVSPVGNATQSYLVIGKKDKPASYSHLVTINPRGGYVASGYEYYDPDNERLAHLRQWYINPFLFFRTVFKTDDLPKPDTTTLAGRRIYYSHIDGDGWNNVSLIEPYREKQRFSSEVIMEKAIIPYADLPVTVAAIAADLDPNWAGVAQGQDIARKIFALPNVEVGSHTYSHPFDWGFFKDGNSTKEKPFLAKYPGKTWDKTEMLRTILPLFKKEVPHTHDHSALFDNDYTIPRAYAAKPFDINREIGGALDTLRSFIPTNKTVKLIQWSGNTEVFEKALSLSREAGIRNINGGDSRFDTEYPSRSWLAPVGIRTGNQWQIYSSASNENTYTNLWTEKFHAFRYLRKTLDNTESPIRLKPFNIYYHMYSGERDASLHALLMNLNYARTQELTPITASHYAGIGDGFFTAAIIPLGENSWQIEQRGALTTIRFDNHNGESVDFARSSGVIGQRLFQGSLYIYLDDAVPSPVITLKSDTKQGESIYLRQSRWPITQFKPEGDAFTFHAEGFGAGSMQWVVPKNGRYEVIVPGLPTRLVDTKNHILSLELPMVAVNGVEVRVRYREGI